MLLMGVTASASAAAAILLVSMLLLLSSLDVTHQKWEGRNCYIVRSVKSSPNSFCQEWVTRHWKFWRCWCFRHLLSSLGVTRQKGRGGAPRERVQTSAAIGNCHWMNCSLPLCVLFTALLVSCTFSHSNSPDSDSEHWRWMKDKGSAQWLIRRRRGGVKPLCQNYISDCQATPAVRPSR